MKKIFAYCDSLCEPNPGEMHVGGWAKDENDNVLFTFHKKIGNGTCNEAEYFALFTIAEKLSEFLKDNKDRLEIIIHSDSQLMTKQMNGIWQTTKEEIKSLYNRAKTHQAKLNFSVQWVSREQNAIADSLAQTFKLKGSGRRMSIDNNRFSVKRNTPCSEILFDKQMGRLLHSDIITGLKEELEVELEKKILDFDKVAVIIAKMKEERKELEKRVPQLNQLVNKWVGSAFNVLDEALDEFQVLAKENHADTKERILEFFSYIKREKEDTEDRTIGEKVNFEPEENVENDSCLDTY